MKHLFSANKLSSSRRKFLGSTAAAAICGVHWSAVLANADTGSRTNGRRRKVLLVSTNVATVGTHVSGTFVKEIAFPFKFFADNDYDIDVVTPKGGKAAIYDAGSRSDELIQIENDARYLEKTGNTLAAVNVKAAEYAGIYYPGGHGQFWDVVDNAHIAAAAVAIHTAGGVVGSAGHGTASLVNVRLRSGEYFVSGKRMTCFPTWAEKEWMDISDYGRLLPFDMQDVLTRRKADLVLCTKETKDQKDLTLVIDAAHRLITGSFASAAGEVARAMHEAIVAASQASPRPLAP